MTLFSHCMTPRFVETHKYFIAYSDNFTQKSMPPALQQYSICTVYPYLQLLATS